MFAKGTKVVFCGPDSYHDWKGVTAIVTWDDGGDAFRADHVTKKGYTPEMKALLSSKYWKVYEEEEVVGGFMPRAEFVPEKRPHMDVKGTKTGRATTGEPPKLSPYKLWWEIQDTKDHNLRSKNAALHREIRAMLGDPS